MLVTDQRGLVLTANQGLLDLVGSTMDALESIAMDRFFPVASQIFLQTHVWPLLLREGAVREIRLQILTHEAVPVPVFVNCQKTLRDGAQRYTWIFFVSFERSRFEQELLDARQRAEDASNELAKSERFIRTVSDALPSMLGYWDTELLCRFANKPYLEWFGRTPEQIQGMSIAEVLGPQVFERNLPHIQAALTGIPQEFERAIVKPNGAVGYLLINYIPDIGAAGEVKGFFALLTNISRLREADAAIRLSASVFEATTEGIMVTDARATISSVNPAFTALTGYTAQEVIGRNANILKSGQHDTAFYTEMYSKLQQAKLWKGEVWSKRKNDSIFLEELSISAICDPDGTIAQYVGVCSDITDRWDKEQTVRHMALHDGLTGLPNRTLLTERLGQLLAMATREPRQIALMFLDLDGFKAINDTWGHEAGDHVLKTVASRLLGLVRPADTVARLGGDEFVLVLDNPDSVDSVGLIDTRIIELVSVPIEVRGTMTHVGASIGIALSQGAVTSPQALLKLADAAMYVSKANGKNTYRFAD